MTINDLEVGQTAKIIDLNDLDFDIRKKLMVMGLLPQTQIQLIRRAPFGDPLQVQVRGVSLALRGKVASQIQVEV